MKITFGTSIIEALSGNLVLRKSKTFLITRRSLGNYPAIPVLQSSQKGSEVRAAPRRKISDLGFSSDPALKSHQSRPGPAQCGDLVSLRRFGDTSASPRHSLGDSQHRANPKQTGWVPAGFWSRMVTKRVRLVASAFCFGSKSVDAHCVGEVTPTALVPFASLVAENQQSSMRKTSQLVAGWC